MSPQPAVRHDAFISYSRRDRSFAVSLEKALENYRPPRDLPVPQRRLDVFRDEADFTGTEYHRSLDRSLSESSALIVICSPNAHKSSYVDDEIRRFARGRDADRIIPILLSGIPNNEVRSGNEDQAAFPPALCEVLAMPLAIPYLNFDVQRDRIHKGLFLDSWYTLLANIYGIRRDELEQREKRRQARFRRLVAIAASTIIAVLSTALVFALISRQEALEQRGIAEVQRKVAEDERDRATRAAEAERLAAIAARRETSTRLAVQALEALAIASEKSIDLAVRAVETFHKPGDPIVLEAVGALQQSVLSLLGSRPLVPWNWRGNAVTWSSDHRWAAAADEQGALHAGRAGSDLSLSLAMPARVRGVPARWGTSIKLAFGPAGLIALRDFNRRSSESRAAILLWPFDKGALTPTPRVVDTFKFEGTDSIPIRVNRAGTWISWSDGYRTTFLRELKSSASHAIGCEVSDGCVSAFGDDGQSFWFAGPAGLRRYRLDGLRSGPELSPVDTLETRLRRIQRITVSSRRERVALLGANGEVEWWDLSATPPVRHDAPNVFTAFAEQLTVYNLDSDAARRTLEFDPSGSALLATFVEAKRGEFGIAAALVLQAGESWMPLLHRHSGRFMESGSRVSGEVGVSVSGYQVKKGDELGVAAGLWAAPGGVVTIGQDGSALFWLVERRASMVLPAPQVTTAAVSGIWLVTGRRDGKVDVWDMNSDEREPMLTLNGHDAPIRELEINADRSRIVSVDESNARRVWDLNHPHLSPSQFHAVTSDWNWLVARSQSADFRLWDTRNLHDVEPQTTRATDNARSVGVDPASPYAVTLHAAPGSPGSITLRLWNTQARFDTPEIEKKWTLAGVDSLWGWSPQLRVRVGGANARVVFSGGSGGRRQSWLVDLRTGNAPAALLQRNEQELDVLPDLSWLLATASGGRGTTYFARDLTGTPGRRVAIRRLRASSYLAEVSSDGRWARFSMTLRQALLRLFTLQDAPALDAVDVGEANDVTFGSGQPPLWVDDDGRLHGLFAQGDVDKVLPVSLPGVQLTDVQWSGNGEVLALAEATRVRVIDKPQSTTAETLADQIKTVSEAGLLPMPPADQGVGNIEKLFTFDTTDNIAVTTAGKNLLIWRRGPDKAWQAPLRLPINRLRLDAVLEADLAPDGKHARFGNTESAVVLSFDPDTLIRLARSLRSRQPEQ